jgi:predicted Zn-dependent peptidase
VSSLVRAIAALIVIASVARARVVHVDEPLSVEHVELRNGLRVILAPDEAASSIVVQVRYASGTATERASEAGFTAVLAKLMSAGSVHVKDFDARIEAAGGWSTAVATSDYLAVTEQVPPQALELVLWLEAERMAGLAAGITAEGVALAREAVDGEYRAAYGDEAFALVTREVQRTLWTGELAARGNPVLGDGIAVKVADVEAVRRFARARLVPNNAILVVAGRFDRAATRKLVERYFGWIPQREPVTGRGPLVVVPRDAAVELTAKDPVAKVVVAFRCAPFDPAIDIAARLIASRLQRLVATKLASDVDAEIVRQRAGELRVQATPAPGVEPAKLAAAVRAELATLREKPPAGDELAKAIAIVDADFLVAVENLPVRAELFASWSEYAGRDPLVSTWRQRLRGVTRDQLLDALTRWLAEEAAVSIVGRPEGS